MWYPPRLPILLAYCRRLYTVGDAGCVRPVPRAVGRFASRLCLLDVAAVCLDASPPSSHRSCLIACRLPLRASARASSLFASSSVPVVHVRVSSNYFSSLRPASSTRRAGRYDGVASALSALLACLLACPSTRHLIRAVRHRMATGLGACLVRFFLSACSPPHGHHRCRLLPAHSPNPIYSSPHHLIGFPLRSLDTGNGAAIALSCLPSLFRFRLRSICACSVEDGVGGCLACLAVVLCILSMRGCGSATVRARPLICLDAPAHPLYFPSPASTHIAVLGVLLHPFNYPGTCRFSFDVPRPVRLLTMADGAWYFYAYPFCGELDKTAPAVDGVKSIGFGHAAPVLSLPPPRCRCGASCLCLLISSMISCRHRIRCRCCPSHHLPRHPSIMLPRSSACPLRLSLRLPYRFASLRSPAPFLVSMSGAMSCCGRERIACLVRTIWYSVGGWGRAACLVMSGDAAMSIGGSGVVLSSWPWLPRDVGGCGACRPLHACLAYPASIARRLSVSPCDLLPRRLVLSPRRACRASALCSPACLVSTPRSVMLTHRVCPSRLILSSATPARLAMLALLVSRVAGWGVPHLASISSCVPPAAFACLSAVLRSARLRSAVADVIAPFLRSVATVPPLSRLAYSPRRSCRWAGRCRAVMFARAIFFFLWDFCAVG